MHTFNGTTYERVITVLHNTETHSYTRASTAQAQ